MFLRRRLARLVPRPSSVFMRCFPPLFPTRVGSSMCRFPIAAAACDTKCHSEGGMVWVGDDLGTSFFLAFSKVHATNEFLCITLEGFGP